MGTEIGTGVPVDLVIWGGRVVSGGVTTPPGWVAVNGDKIVAIGSNKGYPQAKQIIDATGRYVMPGFIDPEQHPCSPIEEHIISETRAAVATGITTAGLMSNSPRLYKSPPEIRNAGDVPSNLEAFPQFFETMNRLSMYDYFMTPELNTLKVMREIPRLARELGVTSFKIYTHLMTGEHVLPMWSTMKLRGDFYFDDGDIFRAMRDVAALGPPAILCFHFENWEIARVLREEYRAKGRKDMVAWDETSPAFCEAGMVNNYAYYAKVTGCPIYVVHCTARETLEEIQKAKAEGVNITAQAAPHYLTVPIERALALNVPNRSGQDFEILWEALRMGMIDCLGTDSVWMESKRTIEEVDKYGINGGVDILAPDAHRYNGSTGFMLPVMLS